MADVSAIAAAKDTLLRALDQLEQAEADLEAAPDRVDLIVVYSIGRDTGDGGWHEIGGWSKTSGPHWTHAALLEQAAEAFRGTPSAIDNTRQDEDDE